jgi:hypothetical protein
MGGLGVKLCQAGQPIDRHAFFRSNYYQHSIVDVTSVQVSAR